jgi:hypothetical protein
MIWQSRSFAAIDPTIIVAPPLELDLSSLNWNIPNISKAPTFESFTNPLLGSHLHL